MEIPQGCVICSGLLPVPLGRVFPCRVSQSRLCFAMFPRWSVSLSHLFACWAPEVTFAKLSSPCPAGKGNWERKDNKVSCPGAEDGGSSRCEQNWKPRTGPRLSWISQHRYSAETMWSIAAMRWGDCPIEHHFCLLMLAWSCSLSIERQK